MNTKTTSKILSTLTLATLACAAFAALPAVASAQETACGFLLTFEDFSLTVPCEQEIECDVPQTFQEFSFTIPCDQEHAAGDLSDEALEQVAGGNLDWWICEGRDCLAFGDSNGNGI